MISVYLNMLNTFPGIILFYFLFFLPPYFSEILFEIVFCGLTRVAKGNDMSN